MPGVRSAWICMLLLAGGGIALADPGSRDNPADADAPAAGEEKTRLLASKITLLEHLLDRSPAAQRIDASADARAQDQLLQARQAHTQAVARFASGDLALAGKFADEGLRAFSGASRLVVDPDAALQAGRDRQRELRERVVSFRAAFERVAAEKGPATARMLDRGKVDALVAESEDMAARGNYEQANSSLIEASALLEVALTAARNRETLTHVLYFDSPAEEFAYEERRNQAYIMLVDLQQNQPAPAASIRSVMDQAVQTNQALRVQAKALAKEGDYAGAIKLLEDGTRHLTRALQSGGMAIP